MQTTTNNEAVGMPSTKTHESWDIFFMPIESDKLIWKCRNFCEDTVSLSLVTVLIFSSAWYCHLVWNRLKIDESFHFPCLEYNLCIILVFCVSVKFSNVIRDFMSTSKCILTFRVGWYCFADTIDKVLIS